MADLLGFDSFIKDLHEGSEDEKHIAILAIEGAGPKINGLKPSIKVLQEFIEDTSQSVKLRKEALRSLGNMYDHYYLKEEFKEPSCLSQEEYLKAPKDVTLNFKYVTSQEDFTNRLKTLSAYTNVESGSCGGTYGAKGLNLDDSKKASWFSCTPSY